MAWRTQRPTDHEGATATSSAGFEGAAGRVAASVMARLNRDMERAAVAELDPAPDDDVLAVGFGPGVGIQELVPRLEGGCIAGIDPSATMVERARRRNRRAVDTGQVVLAEAAAHAIPFPDGAFRGVLAVNSMQLWRPLEGSLREVARVLSPGGALITLTHLWALEKQAPLDEWLARTTALLGSAGLVDVRHRTGSFRSGAGLVLSAHKPRPRNRIAPESAEPPV
jgi:ubiquinone/menaquinone biosynthesis C-methylase UbiE